MKRAAVGDIHLSGFKSDKLTESGLPERLAAIISALEVVAAHCYEHGISCIDIVGDLIHDKSIIYTVAQDAFKDFLVRHPNIQFTILSGNHDLGSVGKEKVSAISVFSEYPNVVCYDQNPVTVDNITIVPWSTNFPAFTRDIPGSDILLSHIGINEAQVSSGLSKMSSLKMSDLSRWKLVILGHYHKPQFLENANTKLYYTGSLIHRDWNDKNEKKRFLVYDTETLEVESIPFEGMVEYREYVVREDDDSQTILADAESSKSEGHKVRVRNLTEDKIETSSDDILVLEKKELDPTNRGIDFTQSLNEKLRKFLDIRGIPESDRQKYLDKLNQYDILKRG